MVLENNSIKLFGRDSLVDNETEKTKINGVERTITNGTDDDGKSYVQNGRLITREIDKNISYIYCLSPAIVLT